MAWNAHNHVHHITWSVPCTKIVIDNIMSTNKNGGLQNHKILQPSMQIFFLVVQSHKTFIIASFRMEIFLETSIGNMKA